MAIRNGILKSHNIKFDGLVIHMLPDEMWEKVQQNNAGDSDVEDERSHRELEPHMRIGTKIIIRNLRQRATDVTRNIQAFTRTGPLTPERMKKVKALEDDLQYCIDQVAVLREEFEEEFDQ